MGNNAKTYFMTKAEMVDSIEQALWEKQFHIYFQPQYNHTNGRMIGAEALVRWIHPQYGLQLPDTFIPLFESEGYITKLDLYVFEEVCRFKENVWTTILIPYQFPLMFPDTTLPLRIS